MKDENENKSGFKEIPLKIYEPTWGSKLAGTIVELEKLRVKELGGPVPPYIFFQLKDIFQMMESLGSARIEGNHTTLAEFVEKIIDQIPKDTKEAHFKSMFDMIDIGMNVVRSHQLLMLPGSEISSEDSRQKYKMGTRFRIQPKCFGNYKIYNETVSSAEIDELCVFNDTMSYQDYLDCRSFDLTVELFYNNGIFKELTNFLKQYQIPPSLFIKAINQKISGSSLKELYDSFLQETENSLWESKSELEKFIKQPTKIEEYIKKELRSNEQLKYLAMAFFNHMPELHEIAFDSAKKFLENKVDKRQEGYLNELAEFSLARKNNLLSLDKITRKEFHYDFINLTNRNFNVNLPPYEVPEHIIEFKHSEKQKETFSRYLQQFGSSMNCLGFILSRSPANNLYREIGKITS